MYLFVCVCVYVCVCVCAWFFLASPALPDRITAAQTTPRHGVSERDEGGREGGMEGWRDGGREGGE